MVVVLMGSCNLVYLSQRFFKPHFLSTGAVVGEEYKKWTGG
jgi:hypothetical protein